MRSIKLADAAAGASRFSESRERSKPFQIELAKNPLVSEDNDVRVCYKHPPGIKPVGIVYRIEQDVIAFTEEV